MSFSYNNQRIAASGTFPIDFVRWRLDDIDSTAYDIEDEEITTLFAETSGIQLDRNFLTAIKVAEHLAVRYRKQVTFSSAGTSMNLSDRADHWDKLVNDLRLQYLSITNQSAVVYPNRPHYDANVVMGESGWIDLEDWR